MIKALRWYGTIGFVLLTAEDADGPYFKVYIGTGYGFEEWLDAEKIAASGQPIGDEVMARHLAGDLVKDLQYRW